MSFLGLNFPPLDPKQPLWMPEGSVRSIGFLMMTATLCYLTYKGIIGAEAFLAIAGLALKFYYDSKEKPKEEGKP